MNKANSDTSIYILGACRTPIGSRFKSLKDFSAADLGTLTIKEVLKRSLVVPGQVSEVILGNVVAAGAGQNIARQAAFGAGMTENSVAYTLNHVCAGGLTAMILAAR